MTFIRMDRRLDLRFSVMGFTRHRYCSANYKGRAVIAFDVSDALVSIIGVFYGGQDYETELNPPDADADPDGGTTQ